MTDEFINIAIERIINAYEMSQHLKMGKLYVAFSGGKDSVALYGVCKKAAEKLGMDVLDMCEFNYNLTTVDPPDLVHFIKEKYPFVIINRPKETMWQLIERHGMPPTRMIRYCCKELKEKGGRGKFCLTGVRWAESSRRKTTRHAYEIQADKKEDRILFDDNDEARREMEHCIPKEKYVCNPIIDWSDVDVWEFIHRNNIAYCSLYDKGWKRIGCIGCPMAPERERERISVLSKVQRAIHKNVRKNA